MALMIAFVSFYCCGYNVKAINEEHVFEESLNTVKNDFSDQSVIVVLKSDTPIEKKSIQDFSDIGCVKIKRLNSSSKTVLSNEKLENDFSNVVNTYNDIVKLTLKTKSKKNVLDTIKKLEKRSDVLYAGVDHVIKPCVIPNDKYYDPQINETIDDVNGIVPDRKWAMNQINLPGAWDIITGRREVRVGVMDSGISSTHPDLANNVNTILSRDFTGDIVSVGDSLIDDGEHGTHVAGIIGAVGNNSLGVAGVCWQIDLVSLKVFGDANEGSESSLIAAIDYANANDIKILNFSGGWYSNDNDNIALRLAINSFNGLLICAAGNNLNGGINLDSDINFFPACLSNVNIISVGASSGYPSSNDFVDTIAAFSNYGMGNVDLFAPGVSIYSTSGNHDVSNDYVNMNGTSMAAPFVSGVAGLILSHRPDIPVNQIKDLIIGNVDTNSAFEFKCYSGGRLNAKKALAASGHYYGCKYEQFDSYRHKGYCACGKFNITAHTWKNNTCIKCGAIK